MMDHGGHAAGGNPIQIKLRLVIFVNRDFKCALFNS
jgi:hypothetical protein